MASTIQEYLQEIENQLSSSLDEKELQAILTETEVHLRERVAEFQEIGLDPRVAELRAVEAFGDCGEYVDEIAQDLPLRPKVSPESSPAHRSRILALEWVWLCGGLGLLFSVIGFSVGYSYFTLIVASLGVLIFACFGKAIPWPNVAKTVGSWMVLYFLVLSALYAFPESNALPLSKANASSLLKQIEEHHLLIYDSLISRHVRFARQVDSYSTVPRDSDGSFIVPLGGSPLDLRRPGDVQDTLLAMEPSGPNVGYMRIGHDTWNAQEQEGFVKLHKDEVLRRWRDDGPEHLASLQEKKRELQEIRDDLRGSLTPPLGRQVVAAGRYAVFGGLLVLFFLAVAQVAGSFIGTLLSALWKLLFRRAPRGDLQHKEV